MDLSVLPDSCPVRRDQDRGVESPRFAVLMREFRITEMESDTQLPRLIEQRLYGGIRHRSFKIRIDLHRILHVVTRKERGQPELRKYHELAAGRRRLTQ